MSTAAPASRPEPVYSRWQAGDVPGLRPLLLGFLTETETDVAPTPRSVEVLLTMGLVAAERGDPCLVAVVDGVVQGFTYWLGSPLPFDTKGAICQALGSYVAPGWRGHGIGTALRTAALEQAWQVGYTRVVGTTYTPAALHSMETVGFKPIGVLIACEEATWRSPHSG